MTKRNGFLIKVGILIVFSVLISGILIVNPEKNDGFPDNRPYNNYNNLDNLNLKTFKISGRIHINGNFGWYLAKNAGICTGEGTYSDPYVIKDLEIDSRWSDSGIFIENSDIYFRIENCRVSNSEISGNGAGIKLVNVRNAIVQKNNFHRNGIGIYLINSDNNKIIDNLLNHSFWMGIFLENSKNNVISLNIVHFNSHEGINLRYSNYNKIVGNTLSSQDDSAIQLYRSNYNAIAGNILHSNWIGDIFLSWSNKNIIIGNIAILFGGNIGERDSEGNVYLFNIGSLFIPSVFLSLFIFAIVVYKSKKRNK